jgi:hypothetical protein
MTATTLCYSGLISLRGRRDETDLLHISSEKPPLAEVLMPLNGKHLKVKIQVKDHEPITAEGIADVFDKPQYSYYRGYSFTLQHFKINGKDLFEYLYPNVGRSASIEIEVI